MSDLDSRFNVGPGFVASDNPGMNFRYYRDKKVTLNKELSKADDVFKAGETFEVIGRCGEHVLILSRLSDAKRIYARHTDVDVDQS
jgi:hypothetical protein